MGREVTGGFRAAALVGAWLILALIVVGCSAAADATASPIGPGPTAPRATSGHTPTGQPSTPDAPADDPWRSAELRDVRSGETMSVADLLGRLVVIEPMAIWCSTCRAQQDEARAALANMTGADVVYISLDVDPNETEPDLARYANEHAYPWHFAVASRDLARALAEAFGDQVLSPPSTPKIVIAPDGQAEVSFGVKSAADLEAELVALLP